jgi:phosphomannomutase/phosphoglucomutase
VEGGHSLIKAKMKETNAALAGEMSGHIFFADRFYGFDDATYAGARLIEILSKTDKKLSELLADLPQDSLHAGTSCRLLRRHKFDIVARIADHFSKTNEVITSTALASSSTTAGASCRASNTQAILVLRFERDSDVQLRQIRDTVESKVSEYIASA